MGTYGGQVCILTVHNGSARACFRETIPLGDSDAQADFDLCVSVRAEGGTAGEYQSNSAAKDLPRSTEDQSIEQRCLVTSFRPLELVLIREIEDGLAKGTRFLHFLVYSFRDAIEDKLMKKTKWSD